MRRLIPVLLAVFALACDESTNPGNGDLHDYDARLEDTSPDDSSTDDGDSADQANEDSTQSDLIEYDPCELFKDTIAPPEDFTIDCPPSEEGFPDMPYEGPDKNFLCTIDYEDMHGFVYSHSRPIDCEVFWGPMPVYETTIELIVDGSPVEIVEPFYDHGGNHQNDALQFELDGRMYKIYHSSFGFGFRACQAMDCLQVFHSDGVTLVTDGCTKDRELPVVCKPIPEDGSCPDLVDEFKPCAGDPNYET